MLRRWRDVCRRSAYMGPDVYRAYAGIAPAFGVAVPDGDQAIRMACDSADTIELDGSARAPCGLTGHGATA